MGFMAGALPYLAQAGMGAAGTAGGMGMQRGMEAVFGGNVENANQAPMPGGGPQQSPAMSILAGLQQQMQQEEMARQQALMALLTQGMGPPPMQPIQMES